MIIISQCRISPVWVPSLDSTQKVRQLSGTLCSVLAVSDTTSWLQTKHWTKAGKFFHFYSMHGYIMRLLPVYCCCSSWSVTSTVRYCFKLLCWSRTILSVYYKYMSNCVPIIIEVLVTHQYWSSFHWLIYTEINAKLRCVVAIYCHFVPIIYIINR